MIALLVAAAVAVGSPQWAEQADVTEHLGAQVPRDAAFLDTRGAPVKLGDLFDGKRPVLLVLAYYECPQLCSLVIDAAARAMRALPGWRAGDQYRVVTLSFAAGEGIDEAARKQRAVVHAGEAWPFLVGDAPAIARVTDALGYRFVRDPATGVIAHPAVAFVLTPDGKVSRHLYGTDYAPRDLKLALLEASDGKTGSFGDKILLRCFHYDASTRRYGLFVTRFLRIGAATIFLVVVAFVLGLRRMRRRRFAP